jgi:hypothetical protein
MLCKLTTGLPIVLLLGTVSAPQVLAQARSHHVAQPHRHTSESLVNSGSDARDSFGMQLRQGRLPGEAPSSDRFGMQPFRGRLPGETPALPFTQDPDSPGG